MDKTANQWAWLMVLPVVAVVAFSAIVPLMTVVNYAVQDIFGMNAVFVGAEWFEVMLARPTLPETLVRQFVFSFAILAIEIPLGIAVALTLPRKGVWVSACLVLLALPLLVPWNVVGTIWLIFSRTDIGLSGATLAALGVDYNFVRDAGDAWVTVVIMDVWHWTSLVVLLCYAGLQAIPQAFYQAARIDGASRWAVFRYIELPKLRGVLLIALLLRFMDSFKIYAEPFVLTGGGPGSATTFLSQGLATMAQAANLGPAAAYSLIYFLIILLVCYVFYVGINNLGKGIT